MPTTEAPTTPAEGKSEADFIAEANAAAAKAKPPTKADLDKAEDAVEQGKDETRAEVTGGIDSTNRLSAADALTGHFVNIDVEHKGVKDAYEDIAVGRGDYGVFLYAAEVDPDTGRPITAVVRLREDSNALVSVPYEALSPAQAGGR